MRTSRRLYPAFDCMSVRIMPSSIPLIAPPVLAAMPAMPSMVALDSTGDPGTNPSGAGTGPIITVGGGSGGGGVC